MKLSTFTNPLSTRLARAAALAALLLGASGCPIQTLTLFNETGEELQPYGVVNLKRQAVGSPIPDGGTYSIDPDGFNMVFYHGDPANTNRPNGMIVQMDLAAEPGFFLTIVYHYEVEPGTEGNDPALQPTKIDEYYYELATETEDVDIRVDDQWKVRYNEN